jgi:N-acetylglucosaminyldiphosphoundecaprenol N-acetyl-beta-D-mannosaminyltransferase
MLWNVPTLNSPDRRTENSDRTEFLSQVARPLGRTSAFDHITIRLGPLRIDGVSERGLLELLVDRVRARRGWVVTYAHMHTLWCARKDEIFAEIIENCDLCYCDGIGISYASILTNRRWIHKVTANNLVNRITRIGRAEKWRIALIGGRSEAVAAAQNYFARNGVLVVYAHDGYFDWREKDALCRTLAGIVPDVVLIGMGQPRQEKFAQAMKAHLPNTVLYCVGGLFAFIAGDEGCCPEWLRHLGFEWMFRLAADPVRLWRRYLVNGPLLLFRALLCREL